ncbi:hypothetical protein AB0467_07025 [Streptomyces sp. NPDC052095]|uniref:hypothetical protein n=1 Tax=unclassified Streptomyces TaxID=2593676 RepID=UPI0034510879
MPSAVRTSTEQLLGTSTCPASASRGSRNSPIPAPTRRVFAAVRQGAEGHPLIAPVLDALAAAAVREGALPLPAALP